MAEKIFGSDVAVITGAGQGIGFEIAGRLASNGASVILNDIDDALAQAAADRINKTYGNCMAFPGDAADPEFPEKITGEAVRQYGKLTLAIANAGMSLFGNFFDYTYQSLQQVMRLNLSGSFFLAQAAAKQMKAQGSGGRILLMSSVTGHQAHRQLEAYGMTKAALEMLAKSLVIELSPWQITINALAPGATATERTLSDRDYVDTWSRITPSGRPATTEDIAHAALFLLSPQARHVTGQSLIVDGGWTSISPGPEETKK
jgi:3-oxoacyl-[acyl-carrier protein] reductase